MRSEGPGKTETSPLITSAIESMVEGDAMGKKVNWTLSWASACTLARAIKIVCLIAIPRNQYLSNSQ